MPVKPTSVTLDDETRARLDRIAGTYERSRSWLIGRAVREYLDREEAYVRAVEEGIEAAADFGREVKGCIDAFERTAEHFLAVEIGRSGVDVVDA